MYKEITIRKLKKIGQETILIKSQLLKIFNLVKYQ